jgi:hypothetical protein
MRRQTGGKNRMESKFHVGQRVKVKLAREQSPSLRDSSVEPYVGKSGEVTDYYWISPSAGQAFFIYTVRISEENRKTLVLHEDEIEA